MVKERITKSEAEYADVDYTGTRPCHDCIMYFNPGKCTLVKGVIEPGGHCKYFQRKKSLPTQKG